MHFFENVVQLPIPLPSVLLFYFLLFTSTTTGSIIVEDVIYENVESENTRLVASESKIFRYLTFERSLGLVQSEALLTREEPNNDPDEKVRRKNVSSSKSSRKKGSRKRTDSHTSINGSKSDLKVDHSCLASSYHSVIISGFSLTAPVLENAASSQKMVRTVVIGLRAGLLRMFPHGCFPFLDIEIFNRLFSLELEEDDDEVLFASSMDVCSKSDCLLQSVVQLKILLKIPLPVTQGAESEMPQVK